MPSDLARQIKRSATLPAVSAALTSQKAGQRPCSGTDATNDTLDVHQVDFRAEGLSARRMHPQHAALQMRAKANAHRRKVAHDFGLIFVKADVKRAFCFLRRHAASAKSPARMDLPVPAEPVISTLEPR